MQRYDLTNPKHVETLVKGQEEWQASAWYYGDVVGELKDSTRFVENSFRRLTLTVGYQREPDDQPIAIMDARAPQDGGPDRPADAPQAQEFEFVDAAFAEEAEQIVTSFRARDGGQAALMGKLGTNIFLVGEAHIVNREVMARRPTRDETPADVERILDWEVRSRDEIRRSQEVKADGRSEIQLVDSPDQRDGVVLLDSDYIERIWRRHPRWSAWADSNTRAAIGTLEELDLLARLARGSIRSRLLAGIMVLPDELDFGAADEPVDGARAGKGVSFDKDIEMVMAAVVSSEADANTVAPLALRGKADFLKEVRWIETPRRYNEEDRAQYEEAVKRLGRTIELPVERILGMSDVNHWTAWQIDEDTYEAYIEPLVGVVAEGITYGLLRPMLLEAGHPEELVSRCVVMADASQLIRRPDRGKVATEGYGLDVPALSGEAWRRANGWGDDDAPDAEELLRHLVFKSGIDPALVTRILASLKIIDGPLAAEIEQQREDMQQALNAGSQETPPTPPDAGGGNPGNDQGPPPNQPNTPAAVAASVDRSHAGIVGDMLGSADRRLTERLLVATDAAMTRALEKAGARLRTRAQQHPQEFVGKTATASAARAQINQTLRDVPPMGIAAALGPAAVAAVQADEELWSGAFTELERQWAPWVTSTQEFAVKSLAGFGISEQLQAEMRAHQEDDRDAAWLWLLGALLGEAQGIAARGAAPDAPTEGEFDPTIVVAPATIREALARAGGATTEGTRFGGLTTMQGDPAGGVATGDLARRYFKAAGFPWTGYRWEYGDVSLRQQPYEPHHQLAGIEFQRWDDGTLVNQSGAWPGVTSHYPGDHRHCRCSWTPIISGNDGASL